LDGVGRQCFLTRGDRFEAFLRQLGADSQRTLDDANESLDGEKGHAARCQGADADKGLPGVVTLTFAQRLLT